MPIEIAVGPAQIVIHAGESVWPSDSDGQISEDGQKGLIFRDTRMIAIWQVFADGMPWELLAGGAVAPHAARVLLTNRGFLGRGGEVAARSLMLTLERQIDGGVRETLVIANNSFSSVDFNLELVVRSDFADLFEVKSGRMTRRGHIGTSWDEEAQCLTTAYANGGFRRAIAITAAADTPASYANGRLSFAVSLPQGATWRGGLATILTDGQETIAAPAPAAPAASPAGLALAAWRANTLAIETSNEEFYRLCRQSAEDLAALRMPFDGAIVPAAGLPWFLALFGRDSLVVALQTLPLTDVFARGALTVLGAFQARERDDSRDAEPGKILHELRRGELAALKLIPHTPYYGTADATMLYLILLHAAWRWTGDASLLTDHLPTAERCLTWIDTEGDRDGDGFQEYERRTPRGNENMGWKDAGDSVVGADGAQVRGPKALCELQGYVYAAWLGMAEIYEHGGQTTRAADLRTRAAALFERFNAVFWDEELGCYLFGLDGQKRPIRSVTSNAGHCLWSGIAPPDRARRVMERLMAPDMFTGWGIRTLSAANPAYNPLSYHNGSVWPHDNGLILQGFSRYGFTDEGALVARGLSGAGGFFMGHRMPELFAGMPAVATGFPVQIPGANVPQAWAAGTVFSVIQALLGMAADVPNRRLRLTPRLPDWLPDLTLRRLRLGPMSFDLRFTRDGARTRTDVLAGDSAWIEAV